MRPDAPCWGPYVSGSPLHPSPAGACVDGRKRKGPAFRLNQVSVLALSYPRSVIWGETPKPVHVAVSSTVKRGNGARYREREGQ